MFVLLVNKEMNMKDEFADDPMMKELHLIREKHYEETKNLSFKEKTSRMTKEVTKFLSSLGYAFTPSPDGFDRLTKVSKTSRSA